MPAIFPADPGAYESSPGDDILAAAKYPPAQIYRAIVALSERIASLEAAIEAMKGGKEAVNG